MARRAARVDANQAEIVRGLRAFGASAVSVAAVGDGLGDVLCGYHGRNYLFEVKDPAQPPSKRRLTPAEQEFHDSWCGQIDVIETLEQAISIIRADEGRGGVVVKTPSLGKLEVTVEYVDG